MTPDELDDKLLNAVRELCEQFNADNEPLDAYHILLLWSARRAIATGCDPGELAVELASHIERQWVYEQMRKTAH